MMGSMHINWVSRGSEEFLSLYHEHGAIHKVAVPYECTYSVGQITVVDFEHKAANRE
jgi:sporulation protein YlmC with PRC-barrel domain